MTNFASIAGNSPPARRPVWPRRRRRQAGLGAGFRRQALIDAARKEGKIVYYTADFTESEQEVIKAFNKRFPFVKVEMVRAPGGQLITRMKTEAAAGKLLGRRRRSFRSRADAGHRGTVPGLRAAERRRLSRRRADLAEAVAARSTLGWSIAYNTELEKNPPKSWMDLCKPQYGPKKIGQVIAPSGGTTWTRIMFERQVLGEDYWKKQAATQPILYPSGAPTSDALVRGEISVGVLLYNIAYIKKRDGAPVDINFPTEGVPLELLRRRCDQDRGKVRMPRSCSSTGACPRKVRRSYQGTRPPHRAEEAAALSGGIRSEGDQGLGAELRAVREAASRLGRGMEQDLRLSAVGLSRARCGMTCRGEIESGPNVKWIEEWNGRIGGSMIGPD